MTLYVIVKGMVTYFEEMEYIKSFKTFTSKKTSRSRVFITYIDGSEDDFYFERLEVR